MSFAKNIAKVIVTRVADALPMAVAMLIGNTRNKKGTMRKIMFNDNGSRQLSLFGEEQIERPKPKRPRGSQSSIVFHDYESFLAKFADNPKTTDDCFTPKDVYEAVVKYVATVIDMSDKVVLRPFFPGGDYENAEYPENGVVIDNPPFSLFTKICGCKYGCTAVMVDNNIVWDNGAVVRVDFASNLFGDIMAMTAPKLRQMLAACPSQNVKKSLPSFAYPPEVVRVSDFHVICNGDVEYALHRSECAITKKLDRKNRMFGDFFLASTEKGEAKEAARLRAQEVARLRVQEAARNAVTVELSPRERRIIERLNGHGTD